jgi:hypothetical protein
LLSMMRKIIYINHFSFVSKLNSGRAPRARNSINGEQNIPTHLL